MERWFASDHHIRHENIIAFCNRPFESVAQMDEQLLEYHNAFVKPQDHVTFLGDVTLRRGGQQDKEWFVKEMRKYHGHKRLHLGNHDHFPIRTYLDAGFEKIYATWRDEQGLLFSHFPLHPTSLGSAVANVHGHIHQNRSPEPVMWIDKATQRLMSKPYINVCVEVTNYRPISYDELLERIKHAKGEFDGCKVGEEVIRSLKPTNSDSDERRQG